MKVYIKFKSVQYAKYVAEFLYKLYPVVLKEQLDAKEKFGKIFGMIDLNNLDYDQREQLANLKFNEEKSIIDLVPEDEISKEVKRNIKCNRYLNDISKSERKDFIDLVPEDEISEEVKRNIKYNRYLNDISKSERKDFIDFDVCLEVEDRQYGRMLAEFFDNLTEGCLEQAVLCKRESDEDAKLIGRYTEAGDPLTEEESKILRENRWC